MIDRRTFAASATAGATAILLAACAPQEPAQPNIRDVIDSNASLSTLATALEVANVEALGDDGPFTVFAPTNNAFVALPEGTLDTLLLEENRDQLTTILQLHVVPGSYPASELVNRTSNLTTASGLDIIVDGFNGVNVAGVNVIQPDVSASNGILHIIDGVILPAE